MSNPGIANTNSGTTFTVNTLTWDEKCTWIMKATIGAPSFFIKNTNIQTSFGSAGNIDNWDIHYLEYSDGTSLIDNVESSSPSFIALNGNGANDAITGTFY